MSKTSNLLEHLYSDLEEREAELRQIIKYIDKIKLEIDRIETAEANREFERDRI